MAGAYRPPAGLVPARPGLASEPRATSPTRPPSQPAPPGPASSPGPRILRELSPRGDRPSAVDPGEPDARGPRAAHAPGVCCLYPMLSHHQKSLGRDWTAPWENLQRCCWNRHISSCVRWPGHYSRAPYPYFSSRHFSLNWRPPCLFESRTQFPYWNWRPDNLSQTSLIHLSNGMHSEGDEPSSKRRKHQGAIEWHWEYICNHNKEKMTILGDKNVDPKCEDSDNKFDFSVMSYNILSQDLLEDNSHLYRHCQRPVLHWSFRFPNSLKEIKHFDADILCLQEVQEDHYGTEIRPSLESFGYHSEYKMWTGRKPDGCAICFKHSKFSLFYQ